MRTLDQKIRRLLWQMRATELFIVAVTGVLLAYCAWAVLSL